jgi:N-acylneuraminate cytidylyltransferase
MNVILVPAKKSSSRVPSKNFRSFYHQLSLVDIAVDLALASNASAPVIVSTDCADYIHSSKAVHVHRRHASLAETLTPIYNVIMDVAHSYSLGVNDKVILLQPTSPFRSTVNLNEFLRRSDELSLSLTSFSLFSVYRVVDAHPGRMYVADEANQIIPYDNALASLQSQQLPACYHRNGCFYAFSVADLYAGSLYSENIRGFEMPYSSSINIDTIPDFHIAKAVYPIYLESGLDLLD